MWLVLFVIVVFFVSLYILYDVIFSTNKKYMGDERTLPQGELYEPYHVVITDCVNKVLEVAYEEVEILSYDGLILRGKYFHRKDGAPLILFFHGYRSCGIRDGNGIFLYAREKGYNILLADMRGHGKSQGKTITFGVMERYDCRSWAQHMTKRFGAEQRIYLCGLSMGAASVLMASDVGLPETVKGIIADCPYSSPKAILCSVMKSLGFPPKITYVFAKWSGSLFGKFDIEAASAVEAVKNSQIPILIIHGEADDFVPCSMSIECQLAGESHVKLVLIHGAGHGMSYCVDAPAYEKAMDEFFNIK